MEKQLISYLIILFVITASYSQDINQIKLANDVFTPPEAEVQKAKDILKALDDAAKEGKGAASLNGKMIDAASARMAENVVKMDQLINSK